MYDTNRWDAFKANQIDVKRSCLSFVHGTFTIFQWDKYEPKMQWLRDCMSVSAVNTLRQTNLHLISLISFANLPQYNHNTPGKTMTASCLSGKQPQRHWGFQLLKFRPMFGLCWIHRSSFGMKQKQMKTHTFCIPRMHVKWSQHTFNAFSVRKDGKLSQASLPSHTHKYMDCQALTFCSCMTLSLKDSKR